MPTSPPVRTFTRVATSLALGLAACLYFATPALAATDAGRNADSSLSEDEARLERIGFRLATANADRCKGAGRLTGMALHDAASYDPQFREAAARAYGLTYGFGLRRIVPGSDAERVGLLPGDEIIAVNGQDLRSFASDTIGRRASHRRTEAFIDMLTAVLGKGRATLTVKNGVNIRAVALAGDAACGGQFVVARSDVLNAWSDGKYVAVTRRMMRVARTDDELAFVVAHEMSHNILAHNAGRTPSRLFAELGFGARRVKAAEIAADATATELLANAGYDLAAPERFLRASGKMRWLDLRTTHPGTRRRIAVVNQAIARLQPPTAQAAGSTPLHTHFPAQGTVFARFSIKPLESPLFMGGSGGDLGLTWSQTPAVCRKPATFGPAQPIFAIAHLDGLDAGLADAAPFLRLPGMDAFTCGKPQTQRASLRSASTQL